MRPPPFSLMGDLFAPMLTRGAALYGYVHDETFSARSMIWKVITNYKLWNSARRLPPLAYLPKEPALRAEQDSEQTSDTAVDHAWNRPVSTMLTVTPILASR